MRSFQPSWKCCDSTSIYRTFRIIILVNVETIWSGWKPPIGKQVQSANDDLEEGIQLPSEGSSPHQLADNRIIIAGIERRNRLQNDRGGAGPPGFRMALWDRVASRQVENSCKILPEIRTRA